MGKPIGMAEYDGYPSVGVPKDRKPLSKDEEEKIGMELRENIRRLAKETTIRKEPLHRTAFSKREIG